MKIDEYLKGNLPIYYILIFLLIAVFCLFNSSKKTRNKQFGVALFFISGTVILSLLLLLGYALNGTNFFDGFGTANLNGVNSKDCPNLFITVKNPIVTDDWKTLAYTWLPCSFPDILRPRLEGKKAIYTNVQVIK